MDRREFGYITLFLFVCGLLYFQLYTRMYKELEVSVGIVQQDCNFTKFQEELRLDSYTPVIPVHLLSKCRHVFYNRIPKSASRTMGAVLDRLAKIHKFQHIFIAQKPDWTFAGKYRKTYLSKMTAAHGAFVLTGHIYYVNFHEIYKDTAVYINIVREPVEWFDSWYSFRKYGSIETGPPPKSSPLLKTNLTECIYSNSCRDVLHRNNSAVHFLCGQDPLCYNVSSEAALQQAERHLDNDYLAVGTLEQLPEYLQLLEFLMPQMFLNATDIFYEIGNNSLAKTKTVQKETTGDEAVDFLISKMETEKHFYDHAADRFQKMLDAKRLIEGRSPDRKS